MSNYYCVYYIYRVLVRTLSTSVTEALPLLEHIIGTVFH